MSEVKEQVKLDAAIKVLRAGENEAYYGIDRPIYKASCAYAIRILTDYPRWQPLIEAAGRIGGTDSFFDDPGHAIEWINNKIISIRKRFIKPIHGNCCTCQTCGMHHDDCLCGEGEKMQEIRALIDAIPASEKSKEG